MNGEYTLLTKSFNQQNVRVWCYISGFFVSQFETLFHVSTHAKDLFSFASIQWLWSLFRWIWKKAKHTHTRIQNHFNNLWEMDIQAAIVWQKIHWKWCSAMMMYEMDACDCCNNNNNNNKIYKILCVIKRNSSYINYVAYNNNTFRIHKKYCIQIYQKQENSSKGEKKSFKVVIWAKKMIITNMKWSNKNPKNAELYYHKAYTYKYIFVIWFLY